MDEAVAHVEPEIITTPQPQIDAVDDSLDKVETDDITTKSFEEQQLLILRHPLLPYVLRAINDVHGELTTCLPPPHVWNSQCDPESTVSLFLVKYLRLIELQNAAANTLQVQAQSYCTNAINERTAINGQPEQSLKRQRDLGSHDMLQTKRSNPGSHGGSQMNGVSPGITMGHPQRGTSMGYPPQHAPPFMYQQEPFNPYNFPQGRQDFRVQQQLSGGAHPHPAQYQQQMPPVGYQGPPRNVITRDSSGNFIQARGMYPNQVAPPQFNGDPVAYQAHGHEQQLHHQRLQQQQQYAYYHQQQQQHHQLASGVPAMRSAVPTGQGFAVHPHHSQQVTGHIPSSSPQNSMPMPSTSVTDPGPRPTIVESPVGSDEDAS